METLASNPFESFGAGLRLILRALLAVLGLWSREEAAEIRQAVAELETAQVELAKLYTLFQAGKLAANADDSDSVVIRPVFLPIFGRLWVCLIIRDLCALRAPDDLIFQKRGLSAA